MNRDFAHWRSITPRDVTGSFRSRSRTACVASMSTGTLKIASTITATMEFGRFTIATASRPVRTNPDGT